MATEFNDMELQEFFDSVDRIIEQIETGKLNKKEVKIVKTEKTLEDTIVKSTDSELGESDISNKGNSKIIKVTQSNGEILRFDNAPKAAKAFRIHATTVRTRCNENKQVDGNTWSYE